uniref:Uncharacterized protein n=1 Tax=Romanomermis culicivorax TaxID=13658 RepID=A0A915JFL6_ROMCU
MYDFAYFSRRLFVCSGCHVTTRRFRSFQRFIRQRSPISRVRSRLLIYAPNGASGANFPRGGFDDNDDG